MAKMKMVKDPKTGKDVPEFAADGKGKMAAGKMVKKKMMAGGKQVKKGGYTTKFGFPILAKKYML